MLQLPASTCLVLSIMQVLHGVSASPEAAAALTSPHCRHQLLLENSLVLSIMQLLYDVSINRGCSCRY